MIFAATRRRRTPSRKYFFTHTRTECAYKLQRNCPSTKRSALSLIPTRTDPRAFQSFLSRALPLFVISPSFPLFFSFLRDDTTINIKKKTAASSGAAKHRHDTARHDVFPLSKVSRQAAVHPSHPLVAEGVFQTHGSHGGHGADADTIPVPLPGFPFAQRHTG